MHVKQRSVSRRTVLAVLSGIAALGYARPAAVAAGPGTLRVWKDPNCGCCTGWVAHLQRDGFRADVVTTGAMSEVKQSRRVPDALVSCHTAEIDGYVIEGHVPAHAIRRLLAERPLARGLAVPGMPIGSPGMEGGTPETYDVVLFGEENGAAFQRVFGRYREASPA